MPRTQERLVDYAAQHYVHAEPRDEGDVAVFTQLGWTADSRVNQAMCEVEVVRDFGELRAVLGY
jgi:hypothetical protein